MIPSDHLAAAQCLWDYHHMGHVVAPADCILVLGSHDLRVAERGAELFLAGLAPVLLMSGGLGNLTLGLWKEPEADLFARVARARGVPESALLIENRSTNTGENIDFSRALLQSRGLDPRHFLVVQKPYMERRAYATFRKRWPGKEITVTSPTLSLDAYPTDEITLTDVIHIMVGDLQRILLYPARGFQIEQPVPPEVRTAYQALIAAGYTRHLVAEG